MVFAVLLVFNVFTQGKVEKSEPFLSARFLDNFMLDGGEHVTCQPALLKVDDNFFMVIPPNENEATKISVDHLQIATRSNMSFKWTLVEVGDQPNVGSRKVTTGFFYRGETTNCTANIVKSTYQFQDANNQYIFCGTCFIGNSTLKAKFCNSLNGVSDDLFRRSTSHFWWSAEGLYRGFDTFHPQLPIPLYTLPLSAFPPNYSELQEDYYRNYKPIISPRDITEVGTWLGGVSLMPATQLSNYDVGFPPQPLPPPQGKIFIDNSTQPSNFFDVFNNTYETICHEQFCSFFRVVVNGIGPILPFGSHAKALEKVPEALLLMFNRTLSFNFRIMDLAADDLQGKEIGATYLCTKTKKVWLPALKVVSVTLGSSAGVFSAIFSYVIVAFARQYDNRKENQKVDQSA
ncbi:hypothetical protein PGTUg99_035212 [Puccinia graminis f. sp. tritici]|uniref:Uncharacterized protein n=1 Tax=Puccinia graminis f. sp. tritici TaxID=56615 RepID=A0A5B0SEV5_PUCGR|nr:hypothetical protein PGTUg99_035212 [Puccinia graminis f. sp. tritici]